MLNRFHQIWFAPIDASFLAVFRIMFGGLLLFESVNYGIFLCLDCLYRSSSMLFKFHHFEWVGLWPGVGLELNFLVMALSAVGVMLGLYYRQAMLIYTLCFSYLFFLEQTLYLNHFYLGLLFCCIMIFVPANAYWSLDAKRRPTIGSATVPAWSRLWIVLQLEIVLIYAGVAKLNFDWLNLEPMRLWMNSRSHDAHPLFQFLTQDAGIAAASYGVIILHLVGAPLLLWKKTRLLVFFIYCVFHLINALVFNIGIFPWMTIAATLVLFPPDWPRQFYAWVSVRGQHGRLKSIPRQILPKQGSAAIIGTESKFMQITIVIFISAWLLVQVAVPLRHWKISGDVAWNEGGHRFSWRMKLRDKRGTAKFYVVRNDAPAIVVNPKAHLNPQQVRTMVCIPDLIWQYAQFLDAQYTSEPSDDVKVYVDANCSLNTRDLAPLINRLVDVSAIARIEPLQNWVLPNAKSLPYQYLKM